MAFTLCKQSHQGIRACDFFAARGLHMDHCALNNTVETGRRAGLLKLCHDQAFQVIIEILFHILSKVLEINITGLHHGGRI